MKRATSVAIAIMCSGGVAAAQVAPTGEAPSAAATEPARRVTLTWSPIHLALPVVELEGEFNLAPNIGIGVIGGAGRVSDMAITATAYEIGGQFNYYFMKPFRGLHGGVEALYLTLGDIEQDSSVTGTGLSIGPYIGYKVLTSMGFTFVAQGGVAYLAVRADSATQTASDKRIYPLINLNIGWSI